MAGRLGPGGTARHDVEALSDLNMASLCQSWFPSKEPVGPMRSGTHPGRWAGLSPGVGLLWTPCLIHVYGLPHGPEVELAGQTKVAK